MFWLFSLCTDYANKKNVYQDTENVLALKVLVGRFLETWTEPGYVSLSVFGCYAKLRSLLIWLNLQM